MLDLTQVRTFVTIAKEKNFTRAAQALHYAQSTVTTQIQQLESQLGFPLFDRLPRSLQLTSAGENFLPHAQQLLATAEQALESVRQDGPPAGPLNISAPESILTYRLPHLLRCFQQKFPLVQLTLDAASICEYGPPVHSGVDIGVSISERITDPQLIAQALLPEAICAVVARDHPLAKERRARPAAMAAEQFLMTEETCSYRALFEREFAKEGQRAIRALALSSVEAMKQCAIARMGIAVLPHMVVANELRKGTLVDLQWRARPLRVYTQLVRRRDRWFSPAMRAFWDATVAELTLAAKAGS